MATTKYYRCHNPTCAPKDQGKFRSTAPVCPQCRISADDPKFGRLIVRLVFVHFDPPTHVPGIGQNVRACDPTKPIQAPDGPNGLPNPWHAGTGVPAAVTCQACQETPEYKAALAAEDDEDGPDLAKAAFERIQTVAPLVPAA